MPAFTFEKIAPPVPPGTASPVVREQRGVLVQILDRLVETRIKRTVREEEGLIPRHKPKPSD